MRNRAICHKCNDVIESKSRHDLVWCSCKNIYVDGGKAYQRLGCAGPIDSFSILDSNWIDPNEVPQDPEGVASWTARTPGC